MTPAARVASKSVACALTGLWLGWCGVARAEVPAAPVLKGREYRVDFSANQLGVDAETGELELSGNVLITVGRYRLSGSRVQLRHGPAGIDLSGGGEIAFCSCDSPPIGIRYGTVKLAPPSDVIVGNAVLRAGPVPIFWTPLLWLRSPDRLSLAFPSLEWRGSDHALISGGVHVPFSPNDGRPSPRALDVTAGGYTRGGARVTASLLTPSSTSLVRWDHLDRSGIQVEAHGAADSEAGAAFAFRVDALRGRRGVEQESLLEAAARRYDRARFGVFKPGVTTFALGGASELRRGSALDDLGATGAFAAFGTGGAVGRAAAYSLAGAVGARGGDDREQRAFQTGELVVRQNAGPVAVAVAPFERAALASTPADAAGRVEVGGGAMVSVPLVRRFGELQHWLEPWLGGRVRHDLTERDTHGLVAASLYNAAGGLSASGAASLELTAGLEPSNAVAAASRLLVDSVPVGAEVLALTRPTEPAWTGRALLRLGRRGGTRVRTYIEGRGEQQVARDAVLFRGEALDATEPPTWAFDLPGWSSGGDVALALGWGLGGWAGADFQLWNASSGEDSVSMDMLGVRGGAEYRHHCGCVALAASASERIGRGGFDARVTIDFMP